MPITVQFATNRVVSGSGEAVRDYGNRIVSPSDLEAVTYATAFVDEVNLTADTVGAITEIQDVGTGGFSDQATGDLADAGRNLLVFVHGFANTFENAITRAAYVREFLAGSGEPDADTSVIAFAWPSLGQLLIPGLPWDAYFRDQTVSGQSGLHIMGFLLNLTPILEKARGEGRRTFLLAHSMGHFALQAALEAWFSHGNEGTSLFDEAFLCAGDERYDTFDFRSALGRLSGLDKLADRVTTLYSQHDLVLGLSAAINLGAKRLGQDGPHDKFDARRFPPERYTMLDCAGFMDYQPFDFATSHQYYRRSPTARNRIAAAMGRPAEA